jgi:hypothetical protein
MGATFINNAAQALVVTSLQNGELQLRAAARDFVTCQEDHL